MSTQSSALSPQQKSNEALNALIIDSIQDIKGKNILQLDLQHLHERPAEFFIICEGESSTQVGAIADNIKKRVKQEDNLLPIGVSGQQSATWICLDYFSTVVHVFYHETRKFYELEDLWSDAKFTEFATL